MKHTIIFLICIILIAIVYGCTQNEELGTWDIDSLTRIDIELSNGEQRMIFESEIIEEVITMFNNIQWNTEEEGNSDAEYMKLTLFLAVDKNSPERLIHIDIWFDEKGAFLQDNEKEKYGYLPKELSKRLEELFINGSKPGV